MLLLFQEIHSHVAFYYASIMAYNTLINKYLRTYYVLDIKPNTEEDPHNFMMFFLF